MIDQVPHSDTFDPGAGRGLAILGSTGSIGTQALDVVRAQPGRFRVEVLTAGRNADLLIEQALEFKPNAVAIADEAQGQKVRDALWEHDIKAYAGQDAIAQLVEMDGIDIVLTALVGFAGLRPTMNAISAGKHIALANKETLVVAGDIVMAAAKEQGRRHSARRQRAQRHLPMPGRGVPQPHRKAHPDRFGRTVPWP